MTERHWAFAGVAPLHTARTSQRDVPTTLNTLATCRQSRAAFSGVWKQPDGPTAFDGDKSPAESADKLAHSRRRYSRKERTDRKEGRYFFRVLRGASLI